MTPFEVQAQLENMVVLVDTREQDTTSFRRRLREIGCSHERKKLDFGDYSARCDCLDLSNKVTIERKMSFDELCNCFCQGRKRFVKEFERAKQAGAKVYLLVENGSWEKAYNGEYRSQMDSKAFIASMTAWLARYNCQIVFCESRTSGKLIKEILYRELKERLENGDADAVKK